MEYESDKIRPNKKHTIQKKPSFIVVFSIKPCGYSLI